LRFRRRKCLVDDRIRNEAKAWRELTTLSRAIVIQAPALDVSVTGRTPPGWRSSPVSEVNDITAAPADVPPITAPFAYGRWIALLGLRALQGIRQLALVATDEPHAGCAVEEVRDESVFAWPPALTKTLSAVCAKLPEIVCLLLADARHTVSFALAIWSCTSEEVHHLRGPSGGGIFRPRSLNVGHMRRSRRTSSTRSPSYVLSFST
jgi:hypothetical protein